MHGIEHGHRGNRDTDKLAEHQPLLQQVEHNGLAFLYNTTQSPSICLLNRLNRGSYDIVKTSEIITRMVSFILGRNSEPD